MLTVICPGISSCKSLCWASYNGGMCFCDILGLESGQGGHPANSKLPAHHPCYFCVSTVNSQIQKVIIRKVCRFIRPVCVPAFPTRPAPECWQRFPARNSTVPMEFVIYSACVQTTVLISYKDSGFLATPKVMFSVMAKRETFSKYLSCTLKQPMKRSGTHLCQGNLQAVAQMFFHRTLWTNFLWCVCV